MINVYLLVVIIAALILVVIIAALVLPKVRSVQRRKALERILERYRQSRQALVLYVMLNRQCSEDVSYQRIARFVKNHIPFDDHCFIDGMLVYDRQSLLDSACSILARDPNGIDKI